MADEAKRPPAPETTPSKPPEPTPELNAEAEWASNEHTVWVISGRNDDKNVLQEFDPLHPGDPGPDNDYLLFPPGQLAVGGMNVPAVPAGLTSKVRELLANGQLLEVQPGQRLADVRPEQFSRAEHAKLMAGRRRQQQPGENPKWSTIDLNPEGLPTGVLDTDKKENERRLDAEEKARLAQQRRGTR